MKVLLVASALSLAACSGAAPDTKGTGSMTSVGSVENTIVPPSETVTDDTVEPDTTPSDNTMPATGPTAAPYLGRWTGVEGMYLVVGAKPGGVGLEMQWDLDHKGNFDATVATDGLHFMRNGVRETLRRTNGDATGLKYLAGKSDCLTVKTGEGYCRD